MKLLQVVGGSRWPWHSTMRKDKIHSSFLKLTTILLTLNYVFNASHNNTLQTFGETNKAPSQCADPEQATANIKPLKVSWEKRNMLQGELLPAKKPTRLEFVHITKTGGTAIEAAGAKAGITWGMCHYAIMPQVYAETNYSHLRKEFPGCFNPTIKPGSCGYTLCWHTPPVLFTNSTNFPNPYDNSVLFTVIRNPYTRMISEYYCRWVGDHKKGENARSINKYIQETLSRYLQRTKDGNLTSESHFIPQSKYIFANIQERPISQTIDHVLFYEDLENEFNFLMDQYGIPAELLSVNEGQGGSGRVGIEGLSAASISLINFVYSDDFEYLGYKKIKPCDLKEGLEKTYNYKSLYMPLSVQEALQV